MTDRTAKPTDRLGIDTRKTVYRLWSDGSIRREQPKPRSKRERKADRGRR